MKIKTKKLTTLIMCLIMCLSNITPIMAANTTIDSIGSINQEDDGVNVGVDKTQSQQTTYSEEISVENKENTLVYVSQASTFSVTIPKIIILDGQTKTAEYLVKVNGNIGGKESVNVIPDEKFNMSQLGKQDIEAIVTQDKVSWLYSEFDVQGNGTIVANDMTAGMWNGSFNFSIELVSTPIITVKATNLNGEDLNASATFILGNEKTTLLNDLVDNGYVANENDVLALINVETNDFENEAYTVIDVSNFAKENDIIVIYHYDETLNEWEYITTSIVDENGNISATFNSFSPIAFVKTDCYYHYDDDNNGLCDVCNIKGTIVYYYHTHDGFPNADGISTMYGGCYKEPTTIWTSWIDDSICYNCGGNEYQHGPGYDCDMLESIHHGYGTGYKLSCGKTEETIDYQKTIF